MSDREILQRAVRRLDRLPALRRPLDVAAVVAEHGSVEVSRWLMLALTIMTDDERRAFAIAAPADSLEQLVMAARLLLPPRAELERRIRETFDPAVVAEALAGFDEEERRALELELEDGRLREVAAWVLAGPAHG